jgi:hypothetical protein
VVQLNDRRCPICGGVFTPKHPNQKYDKEECQKEGRRWTINKYERKRRQKQERKEYLADYMYQNGKKYKNNTKYDLGSKYTNKGIKPQITINEDGTKSFRKEAEAVRKMSYLLMGHSNITKEAISKM